MNLVMLTRLYLLPRLVLYNSGLFVALLSQPVLDQIFRVSAVLFFFLNAVCACGRLVVQVFIYVHCRTQ